MTKFRQVTDFIETSFCVFASDAAMTHFALHEDHMKRFWLWLLAVFHLSDAAVCEMSRGSKDYHDYPDGVIGEPWHFYTHKCKRCGKEFTI